MKRNVGLSVILLALVVGAWATVRFAAAQGQSNEPNVVMLDNCASTDPDYVAFGGCPQGGLSSTLKPHQGDVPLSEFLGLLFSPLGPGILIGHPSWRNEPSYVTVRAGQTVRVPNRGGRTHTFTEVANFGGGFIPPLIGALGPAPECIGPAANVPDPALVFVAPGQTQQVTAGAAGLHKYQCCIHPWMRAAIRAQ